MWANFLSDRNKAVYAYRSALSLGGTAPLPTLYTIAGAGFAFDSDVLVAAVSLMERTRDDLKMGGG